MCVTCLFLLWSLSLSVCQGYATLHEAVADKQREYETFIVPALMNNNISVLTLLYVVITYGTAAYTIAMATVPNVAKTWMQKKEFVIAVIYFYVLINLHESLDPDNDDANEEDDDWKTGPQFLKKEVMHQVPYSSHSCGYDRYRT